MIGGSSENSFISLSGKEEGKYPKIKDLGDGTCYVIVKKNSLGFRCCKETAQLYIQSENKEEKKSIV